MMYIYTVLCVVYRLHQNGEKLPKEVVRQHASTGWLYYGPDDVRGHRAVVAQLLSLDELNDNLLPQLVDAKLLTIKRGGMLFDGYVSQYYGQREHQRWWVLPSTPLAP